MPLTSASGGWQRRCGSCLLESKGGRFYAASTCFCEGTHLVPGWMTVPRVLQSKDLEWSTTVQHTYALRSLLDDELNPMDMCLAGAR